MVRAPACSEDIRAEVAELLGVRADAIHPGSNLIGQGLDSIRMMTLAGRWRRQGIAIDFATLAAAPTIEAWSELVTAGSAPLGADQPAPPVDGATGTPASLFRSPRCSTRCGSAARTTSSSAGWPGTSTSSSTVARSTRTGCAGRPPGWRFATRCCGCGSCPTGRSASPRRTKADFPVTVVDLRGDERPHVVEQRLAALREAKSHQQLDGAVFELALTLLPGERSRLHVDLDMQAADAMSYRTLMADLAALYLGRDLPELGYTYREYRQATARRGSATATGPRRRPGLVGAAHPAAAGPAGAAVNRRARLTREHPALALAGPGDPRRAVRPRPRARHHPGDDAGRGVRERAGALVDARGSC